MKIVSLDKNFIINNIQNYSQADLALKSGCSVPTLVKYMKAWKIKKTRKYGADNIDINFFESIDTEEKAYWLGFIFADGCVYRCKAHDTLAIGLNIKDKEHLLKFQKAINSNKKLYYVKKHNTIHLRIESKKIVDDLIKLGCVPNKSLVLKFPNELSSDLIRHFIRGYFDGDGSIEKCKSGTRCSFIGTKDMLENFSNIIEKEGFQKREIESRDRYYLLRYIKKQQVFNVCYWMYNDSTIYLNRKYNRYKELLHDNI